MKPGTAALGTAALGVLYPLALRRRILTWGASGMLLSRLVRSDWIARVWRTVEFFLRWVVFVVAMSARLLDYGPVCTKQPGLTWNL